MSAYRDRCYNSAFVFMAAFVVVSGLTWSPTLSEAAYDALILKPQAVRQGQVWRLFTYAFLAPPGIWFIFRLLVFYYIAAPLEAVWGTRRLVTLMAVAVLGGGATATLMGKPLEHGEAMSLTLMLIHGFLFPDSRILLFFLLPIRIKTLAIISTALFLGFCVTQGLMGLVYFAGMLAGVFYFVFVTKSVPWLRRSRRRIAEVVSDPGSVVKRMAAERVMDCARQVITKRETGNPLSEEDRAFVEELVQRSDPTHELCSPYSFSPNNDHCPPCEAFGLCLRRFLETADEDKKP